MDLQAVRRHPLKEFDQRFEKAFSMAAFTVNRHLMDHMRRLLRELEIEDLETTMIWGVLAHLNVSRVIRPGAPLEEILTPAGFVLSELHPVRLSDVTQVSALPKETVRRKLERLKGLGKVERLPDGRWQVLRSGVDARTYEFTRETVRRLLQTARQIEDALQQVKLD